MDVSSINSDLIRGNVTTIILKALLTEDRYGYDILREIEVKSGGQYKLKQPTLYSSLKRLEKQGLINSYWGDESDTEGGRRRYYALTDAGRNYLDKMQSEYEYSRTILDSLLSEDKFDFENKEAPFDINSLRPYTKRGDDEEKSVSIEENVVKEVASNEIAEQVKPVEPQDDKPKQMFAPLDKGNSSYDSDYRHTATSFSDMLGKIDNILNKKEENVDEVKIEKVEEKVEVIEKPVETKTLDEKPENIDAKSFFFQKTEVKQELSEEEQIRRENAKRALYGDTIQEKVAEPVVQEEKPEVQEKLQETSNLSAREMLFGNKNNESPAPAPQPQYDEAHEKAAKLIFDKYNRPAEEKPAEPEVKYEPKDVFYKYQPEVTANVVNDAQPQNVEVKEQEEKTYKPEEIFDKYKKKEEVEEKESLKVNLEPSPVPPAAYFSFRRDKESNVNYRDAFSGLRSTTNINDNRHEFVEKSKSTSSSDLKTKLFTEGYKLRTYSRENTENYYSLNYIKKNRINRDCYALMYVLICLEVLIGWGIFKDRFSSMAYAAVCIIALVVPIIPFIIWTTNPDKRVHANYSFKTSILNRFMLYLNLLVIDMLVGFFGLNANINDGASMIAPILVPALLLLNIPLSSVVYTILYKTKKYHIS